MRRSRLWWTLLAVSPAMAWGQDASPTPAPAAIFAVTFRTGPGWDKAKAPAEQKSFAEHGRNIRALGEEGRLVLGGRFGEVGLLLVRAADEKEARSLIDRDPSEAAGTFTAEVHRWSTFADGCVERARR
jgi:uncharacterized protein YciI